jgi:hypothetical protein
MTDRLKGLTVAFAHDIREDDAEAIVNAIKIIKGVLDVKPIVSTHDDWIIESRVRRELGEKLIAVLYPKAKS